MSTSIIRFSFESRPARFALSVLLVCLTTHPKAAAQNLWQQANGPYGGFIRCLAINSSGHIFAGTSGSGIFRSMDNGGSWNQINTGLTNADVRALAINPATPGIFAGTFGGGAFRSTDNGGSWTPINTGLTNSLIYAFAINSSSHIFAATSGGGIFRSMDNGDNWTQVNTGLTNTDVRALAINPATPGIFAGTSGGGVFRSTDNGSSWTKINIGLTSSLVFSLAINSSGHIFAGTSGGGIFRSTDNGGSWTKVNAGLTNTDVRSFAITSNGQIFAGTFSGGVFLSTNNGESWTPVNTGLTSTVVLSLANNSNDHVFAATFGGGAFRSIDNGGNWISVNTGLTNTDVRALAINNSSGHIFAGANGGGVFRSMDNGVNWSQVNTGLTNTDVRALAINSSGDIFSGTNGGGAFRSTDNGDSWTPASIGLTNAFVFALAINGSGDIFAGTSNDGVFRSSDNGDSWTPTGLTDAVVFALANNASGDIFAGTSGGGVFRSSDNGDNWTPVNIGLANPFVRSFAINDSGDIFTGTSGGIFRSTDSGNAWMPVNTGLANTDVRSLAINSNGNLFAGTFGGGIFCSMNNGNTWTPVSAGLTRTTVHAVVINAKGHVLAGTEGGGVFQSIDSAAPEITHTPSSPPQSGQILSVEAEITDDIKIGSVTLSYRTSGDASFTPVPMTTTDGTYRGLIPADAVISRGVEYYIVATDLFCNITQSPRSQGFFSVQIRVTSETKPTAQPGGSDRIAYRLISVPYQLDDSSVVSVLLDNLGGYNRKKWRLFGLVNGQYSEFPNAGDFTPGNSMFLIVKDPDKVIDAGPGQSMKTDEKFPIALAPGHNFIASPFNFSIPLSRLSLAKGNAITLRTYNTEWIKADSLRPWEGYHLANIRPTPDTLFVNPNLSPGSLLRVASKPNERRWYVQILATCGEARDAQNFAGVAPESSDGWDENDLVEPPPIGEYVSLYFPHREWQKVLSRYSEDLRSPETPNQRWNFAVESNITVEVITVRFDWQQEIPSDVSVFLVDFELGHKQNLRENATYQFRSREPDKPKELALIVGKESFISEQTADLTAVPSDFLLSQNFPNPFNPATTIRYGLPKAERVTLKIYNLLGEEVALIMNDELRAAGYHAAIWDGRDKAGRVAASGVYVYRMQAGDFIMTKKLALVK